MFKHYTSDLHKIPFSDEEGQKILGISKHQYDRAIQTGVIKKSLSIPYRFDLSIKFSNFYDLVEYSFLSSMQLLPFQQQEAVMEVLSDVLDQFAITIDEQISYGLEEIEIKGLVKIIEELASYHAPILSQYWLYEGEKFCSHRFSSLCVEIWCMVFEKSELPPIDRQNLAGSVAK